MQNATRFPAQCFRQFTPSGELLGIAVMAACFDLYPGSRVRQAWTQPPLVMADLYEGDPLTSAMLIQGDLVPYKAASDITVLGDTHAPGGKPAAEWECGVAVGAVSKQLRVTGPRSWRREPKTRARLFGRRPTENHWYLDDPLAVPKVTLGWDKAFGGPIPDGTTEPLDVIAENPIGCGVLTDAIPSSVTTVPAPQIDTAEQSARRAFARPEPQGLGPIPPFWRSRQQFAGTYDNPWLRHRHPLLPRDFDMRFWSAAALMSRPWLRGGEAFRLLNLLADQANYEGRLPGLAPAIILPLGNGSSIRAPMLLDGVQFDLRPSMMSDGKVGLIRMTWRVSFPWTDRAVQPQLVLEDMREVA